MSWPSSLLPEAVIFGLLAAVSGGVLGGAIGRALAPPVEELAPSPRWAVIAAGVGLVVARRLPAADLRAARTSARRSRSTEVTGAPERTRRRRGRSTPPDAAENAEWFKSTSWQGGSSIVADMREVSPGVYRTTKPMPGLRQLEDDAAPAQGRRRRGPAGLPARGQGDPGQGGPGRGAR